MATSAEVDAMRRAIAISAKGVGTTSPNPPVGCVVLARDGRIVGEGYHVRKGEAHAEAHALAAAGSLAHGGTAVVTLEPCNHVGRTPACRQALIDAKVGRVVIAVLDPTSRCEGGAARLRAAGVDVEVGVLASEARVVLGPWLTALGKQRPTVTWPYVARSSGIDVADEDLEDARLLRLEADAVLRGDGRVTEAVPGSHGIGMLHLADYAGAMEPDRITAALYEGGVRRLLLVGGLAFADPFLALGLVDRVYAYVPEDGASTVPSRSAPWLIVPPGFSIVGAVRLDGFVRVEARQKGSSGTSGLEGASSAGGHSGARPHAGSARAASA